MDLLGLRARQLAPILFLLAMACPLCAQNATEDKVKAAFIFNFTHFVKWPTASLPDSSGPLTICTQATASLDEALKETVKDKSLDGRPFVVRKLKKENDLQSCQVAFVSGNNPWKPSPGVLTIADDSSAAAVSEAGVITFVLDSNRVRFSINSKAAERAGLAISSKLLTLAVRVDH